MGNGNGTFQTAQNFDTGGMLSAAVVVGDFNRDGKLDLAVASESSASVSVLMGNGDGTFQTARNFAVGGSPVSLAVGDFNGDSKLDLATANVFSDTVSVLLGNGDGTFQTAQVLAAGGGPNSVAVGDFNGDGKLDLAVANQFVGITGQNGNVSVLFGNGNGTFQSPQSFAAGAEPASVVVGDFNGDGKPDLAVASCKPTFGRCGAGQRRWYLPDDPELPYGLLFRFVDRGRLQRRRQARPGLYERIFLGW